MQKCQSGGKLLKLCKKYLFANKVKFNPHKTEFIMFSSKSQHAKYEEFVPVKILGNLLLPSEVVRNLGVWFDLDISFSCHVMKTCKDCLIYIRNL